LFALFFSWKKPWDWLPMAPTHRIDRYAIYEDTERGLFGGERKRYWVKFYWDRSALGLGEAYGTLGEPIPHSYDGWKTWSFGSIEAALASAVRHYDAWLASLDEPKPVQVWKP
jgi:hypothetical protein